MSYNENPIYKAGRVFGAAAVGFAGSWGIDVAEQLRLSADFANSEANTKAQVQEASDICPGVGDCTIEGTQLVVKGCVIPQSLCTFYGASNTCLSEINSKRDQSGEYRLEVDPNTYEVHIARDLNPSLDNTINTIIPSFCRADENDNEITTSKETEVTQIITEEASVKSQTVNQSAQENDVINNQPQPMQVDISSSNNRNETSNLLAKGLKKLSIIGSSTLALLLLAKLKSNSKRSEDRISYSSRKIARSKGRDKGLRVDDDSLMSAYEPMTGTPGNNSIKVTKADMWIDRGKDYSEGYPKDVLAIYQRDGDGRVTKEIIDAKWRHKD